MKNKTMRQLFRRERDQLFLVAGLVTLAGCGGGSGNNSNVSPALSVVSPTTSTATSTATSPSPVASGSLTPNPIATTPPIALPKPVPAPAPPVTPPSVPVTFPVTAQFNPRTYAASAISGSLVATNGDSYRFDTSALPNPTLTNTTTNVVVATGQYVTQTFETERKSVTYAVFDFSGDLHIGGKCNFLGRGKNPLVLLALGNITLDGGAVLDVSADGTLQGSLTYPLTIIPGPGGGGPDEGPGTGGTSSEANGSNTDYYYGGSGFGGRGGVPSVTYGDDFAGSNGTRPHLQGGSGGISSYTTGGPGGGAVYVAAVGMLTINDGLIKALGGHGCTGGSGGGVALFGGKGVSIPSNGVVVTVFGGSAGSFQGAPPPYGDGHFYGGGGGGRVVIGYPAGSTPPLFRFSIGGGNGVGNRDGMRNGEPGVITSGTFAGF